MTLHSNSQGAAAAFGNNQIAPTETNNTEKFIHDQQTAGAAGGAYNNNNNISMVRNEEDRIKTEAELAAQAGMYVNCELYRGYFRAMSSYV